MPRTLIFVALLVLTGVEAAQASVVMFSNRAAQPVTFTVDQAIRRTFTLKQGELLPVAVLPTGEVRVEFESAGNPIGYELDIDSVYFFHDTELGGINLQQIGIRQRIEVEPTDITAAMTDQGERRRIPSLATIPVKLMVDDDEKRSREQWEAVLRNRLQRASQVFERACRIRFEVVEVGTWVSKDDVTEFHRSLAEFEHKVLPNPARLVIGFTSQYDGTVGQTHLGGTRGAFYPYILIREWTRYVSESERLEVLVHELAHYLGAVHSPEVDSVMRPVLGDRRSRRKDFRIDVDPVNALALYLIGEEYRARGNIRKLTELSLPTRRKLYNIYAEIRTALPRDPAPAQYMSLLGDITYKSEHVRQQFSNPPRAGLLQSGPRSGPPTVQGADE